MPNLNPPLFILVLASLIVLATLACQNAQSPASSPAPASPPPPTQTPPAVVSPARPNTPTSWPTPTLADTPTPWPTPDLDATVAAEVRLRLHIEEQVLATLEAEASPEPTVAPPGVLLLEIEQPREPAVAGKDVNLDFTFTNQLPVTLHEVNVDFVVSGAGHVSFISSDREGCRVAVCRFRTLEGHEVVTGRLNLDSAVGFEQSLHIELAATWHLQNSEAMASHASASVELIHDSSPGMLLWSTPVDATPLECGQGIAVDAEAVYASLGDSLVALSRTGGELLWTSPAGGQILDPVVFDGSVLVQVAGKVVGNEGDQGPSPFLRSLDAATGAVNWERQAAGPVKRPHLLFNGDVFFVENVEPAGGSGRYSRLVALDAATGNPVWQRRFDGSTASAPVQSQGYLFLSAGEPGPGYLHTLDPSEGELVRSFATGVPSSSSPLVVQGSAYLVSSEGSLLSFDLSSGNRNWQFPHPDRMTGPPLYANQLILVTAPVENNPDARFLYGVAWDTGMMTWAFGVSGLGESFSVSGDSVYAVSPGKLWSFDAAQRKEKWQVAYGDICAPVKAHDGVLYGQTVWDNELIVFALYGNE